MSGTWRQQQPETAPPPPPGHSVPELLELHQCCADDDEAERHLEHVIQQHRQTRAQHRADYRNGVLEVQRVAPLFCRAYQQSLLPLYGGNQWLQQEVERLRHTLVRLVGEAAAQRIETDASYRPSWFER